MSAPSNPPEYNPKIPQVKNTIADSQSDFQGNFGTLYDAFIKNHVALDDATNPGNHTHIDLVEQSVSLSTSSQELAIYSKKVANQTDQVFMRYQNNGKEFQITNYQIYSILANDKQESYFSFLPGGIIVYFGKAKSNGTTTFNITLDPAICRNIMGVNLGGIGSIKAQPNVSLLASFNGPFHTVVLKSALAMVDQFYIIYGNI